MSRSAETKPRIMLVGAAHWSNPGLDYQNTEFDDMLAPGRQREIQECITLLARFAPTKVALEVTPSQSDMLQAEYERYRMGEFELTANERHQLGFRLAEAFDHPCIFGIDWHDSHREIGWDTAIAFAQEHHQQDFVSFFSDEGRPTEEEVASEGARIRNWSVRDQLIESSDLDILADGHRIYMDLARIGEADNYIGADVILRWYERNMKIFVNLARLASSPEDRVLVVIGGGHLPLLTHFIEGAKRFRLESVKTYLDQ